MSQRRSTLVLALLLCPLLASAADWPTRGWTTSTPAEQGMDPALLQLGDVYVRTQCPTRYSFLVVRNGALVWEQYYHGMNQDRRAHVMSVSKSVLSLLIGQALDQGRIDSLDRSLPAYFPEYFSASTDSRKRQVTLRHLLTMSAGFQWAEATSGGDWIASRDWYKFIIDLPLVSTPGAVFNYNTGLSHLLTGALARATGESPYTFAVRNLFEPLGVTNFQWDTDPRGNYIGGFHMYFTSRDLAKFGYLALRNGYWADRQLVSRSWIDASTSLQMTNSSSIDIGDYGYHWWLRPQWGYSTFMASGFGGQYIFVVPGLDLVVVSTADDAADTRERHLEAFNLLTQYVIPSIRSITESQLAASPRINAVVNAANFSAGISPGSWTSIIGANLARTTRAWGEDDIVGGNLPVQLDAVAVTIGGKPAYVEYVSPAQLNVLVPTGLDPGDVVVSVTSAPGRSTKFTTSLTAADPAFFLWNERYVVAQHADSTAIGAASPAKPGEPIVLYGTGFGRTEPVAPAGAIARHPAALPSLPAVTIGGIEAVVDYAGLTPGAAGLYQINARVPATAPDGDLPISLTYGRTAPIAYLTVHR